MENRTIKLNTEDKERIKEERRKQFLEEAKQIIEDNNKKLRRIPERYKYLRRLFDGDIKKLYFLIMGYIADKNIYPYWRKKSYHITTQTVVKLRKKSGEGTANRHLNFLCAMGVLQKYKEKRYATKSRINGTVTYRKPPKYLPMNTFFLVPLDLEELDNRCKLLIEHKITKGNISSDKLEEIYIAKKIYSNNISGLIWKKDSYDRIKEFLEAQIPDKGYATKQDIYENVILNKKHNVSAVDKVLTFYRDSFNEDFRYGRPKKEEKAKYKLTSDSWIITEHPAEEK